MPVEQVTEQTSNFRLDVPLHNLLTQSPAAPMGLVPVGATGAPPHLFSRSIRICWVRRTKSRVEPARKAEMDGRADLSSDAGLALSLHSLPRDLRAIFTR